MLSVKDLIEELRHLRSDLPVNLVVEGPDGVRVYGIASYITAQSVDRNSDHVQTNDNVAAFISTVREF